MTDHHLTRNPFGERPTDPVERDAYDWLTEHVAESGESVVKSLADVMRRPRCPDCRETACCYSCATQGGPGADLMPHDPNAA
jgi:hypothetical protein